MIDTTDPDWLAPTAAMEAEWGQSQAALGFDVYQLWNWSTTTVEEMDAGLNSFDSSLNPVFDWAPVGADPGSLDFPRITSPVDLTPTESTPVEDLPIAASTDGPLYQDRPWGVPLEVWNQMQTTVELIPDESTFPVEVTLPEAATNIGSPTN